MMCDQSGHMQLWDLAGEANTIVEPFVFDLSTLGAGSPHRVSQMMWSSNHPNWVGLSCNTHLDILRI
jgi:hypothetical protein